MKTIYDIAKSLKLSPSTVSRALRDDPRVSNKTCEKVKEFACSVGYTPNANARKLASGQSHCFWLLTPGLFSGQEQELSHCISDYFAQKGYDLMILTYREDPETFKRMLARLKQNTADGAFIIGPHDETDFAEGFELLEKEPLPLIYLMRGPRKTKITRYYLNEATAAENLLNELLSAGAETAILGFTSNNSSDRLRREAIEFKLRQQNIHIYYPENNTNEDFSALRKKHVCFIGSDTEELMEFNEKYFSRFPESCRLSVGIFDEWKGSNDGFYNIFTCQFTLTSLANDASATMLRMQDDPENLRISRLSRSKSHRINYIKYHSTQKRSTTMSMRWNIAIVAAILLVMSLIATLWQPDLDLKGRKPLVWTTDPNPQRDDQVSTFNNMFSEHKLRVDPDNTGTQKVITQCSANMGPDLIDGVTNHSYQLYHNAGVLRDITEEAKEMGFGPDTLSPAIRPLVMLKILDKDGKIKERQFTYPCNVFHTYIILNKNVFEKNGVSLPKGDITWEELLKKAQKLTVYKHKDDSIPESFGLAGVSLINLIWQKGGAIINKDGTRSLLNSEAALDAAMFLHDLYYKYKVMPTPTQKSGMATQGGWGGGGYFNYLADGRIAMVINARYSLIQFRRLIRSQEIARKRFLTENPGKEAEAPQVLKLGACLMPRFKGQKRYCQMGARGTGINADAKNPQGALKFMQYLASKQYADLINKGGDSKPGPSKYYKLDLMINPAYPGEKEVHAVSLESTPYGRAIPRSPFIMVTKLNIILQKVEQKIVAEKNLTREDIASMLKRATMQTDEVIARNIKRNKHLYKFYNKLLEQGAQPIRINLDEVSE